MSKDEVWRFDELAALAAHLVNVAGSSKRVRWNPQPRTIRYYTTIGLLDCPLYLEGRVAFYGRKHLAQIVAIKKLQATGLSLAQIQERLAGLPDKDLYAIAGLPDKLTVPPLDERRKSFWTSLPKPQPSPQVERRHLGKKGATGVYVSLTDDVTLFLEGFQNHIGTKELEKINKAAKPLLELLASFEKKEGGKQ